MGMSKKVTVPKSTEDIRLSSSVTIKQYRELEAAKDREQIAVFVVERFQERYLEPALSARTKSGFALMAINCLMIESLVSFRRGWKDTRRLSESAFCFFFDREDAFADFRGNAHEFYVNVRCGILHQAETTGGWLIHLKKEKFLFDGRYKIVNAREFTERLQTCLSDYQSDLVNADWDDEIWGNFRKKLNAIIENCK